MASPSAKTLTCVLLISKLMLKLFLSSLLTPSALILLLLLLLMITGACLVKFPKLGSVIAIVKEIVVQIFLPRKGLLKMDFFVYVDPPLELLELMNSDCSGMYHNRLCPNTLLSL